MEFSADAESFMHMLADISRLPDETVALAFIYVCSYNASCSKTSFFDSYLLALSALSLASKISSCRRSPSALIIPAYNLLHPNASPITANSSQYPILRRTMMRTETILQRALGYNLARPSPLNFTGRYLDRALRELAPAAEDYSKWTEEERAQNGVLQPGEGGLERKTAELGIKACSKGLVWEYGSRVCTAAVIWIVLNKSGCALRNLNDDEQQRHWLKTLTRDKIDFNHWRTCVDRLQSLHSI